MKTSKIVAIILIVLGLGLGYIGVNKIADSTKEVNFLGLIKIDASNEEGQTQGYIYVGLAAVLFFGGIYSLNKTK